jgi:LacI family transcriptional regulator, galactose operon repressor
MKKGKANIKDIARIAKVSPTTVSMAINNRPRISEKTRSRILQIAKDLSYQPDFIARSLKNKTSYTLGLFIKDIADPFYPELAKGIGERANELGYSVILCNVNDDSKLIGQYLSVIRSKGVDGIIFTTMLRNDPYVTSLLEESFPFVTVVRTVTKYPLSNRIDSVELDNFSGGYQAVTHLCKLGHDRIGIIAGGLKTSTAVKRTEGAKAALEKYGIEIDKTLIAECHYSRKAACQAAERFLKTERPPTAIFAQDDNMALGVREAILSAGKKIPEDIALVGFDDIDVSALRGIELTTINQKKTEMGALSVEILVRKIEEKNPSVVSKIVLQPELIIRKSCGFYLGGYRADR